MDDVPTLKYRILVRGDAGHHLRLPCVLHLPGHMGAGVGRKAVE
jgi:hypothetical protein